MAKIVMSELLRQESDFSNMPNFAKIIQLLRRCFTICATALACAYSFICRWMPCRKWFAFFCSMIQHTFYISLQAVNKQSPSKSREHDWYWSENDWI